MSERNFLGWTANHGSGSLHHAAPSSLQPEAAQSQSTVCLQSKHFIKSNSGRLLYYYLLSELNAGCCANQPPPFTVLLHEKLWYVLVISQKIKCFSSYNPSCYNLTPMENSDFVFSCIMWLLVNTSPSFTHGATLPQQRVVKHQN